ncbi:MAG: S49 family peptidase, partial [Pseudomonadota bacterium]|nr:S49 family peptidase [Pseudomonadota bacterium]
ESIRRAIVHAQEKGKPVIVSMGEAAASGGYWISAPADHIFAAETTFTGSIGVTGGKFSLKEMWSKLDVNWDSVSWGENSSLWSFNQPYTASERERMNALMDQIYNKFVAVVAEGRNMSPEQVDAVAGGRVWLGAQAKDVGLVDDLGGLDDALDYTANLLGHNDRQDLHVTVLPRPKTAIEKIVEFLEMQASIGKMYDINVRILEWIEPLMGAIASQENHVSALAVTPEGKI